MKVLTFNAHKGKDMNFEGIEKYISQSSQTRGRGFHVAMTYFWVQIVYLGIVSSAAGIPPLSLQVSESNKASSQDKFSIFLFLNPYVVDGNLWIEYYSKEVMMSPAAKEHMVLPDKKPLPNLVIRDAIPRSHLAELAIPVEIS
jgi:hypothetical protein